MFKWIWALALKKSASKGLKAAVATFAGASTALQQFGVTVTIDQAVLASAISGTLISLYEFFRNYLKSQGKDLP